MKSQIFHLKRQAIAQNFVLGIDPGKEKHSGSVLDPSGLQQGGAFSFPVTRTGYDHNLWRHLERRIKDCGPDRMVVAIETSCNLWVTLAHYLLGKGYRVLLVSPLTTYHARPMMHRDFSRTDPRDAFLVADSAQKGSYDLFRTFEPHMEAAHQLSIAYDKLRKDLTKSLLRTRSLMERVFPEFLHAFNIRTKTSRYLLERYFLPRHFEEIDIEEEGRQIHRISRGSYGVATLQKLKEEARTSIGIPVEGQEDVLRIILNGWIEALRRTETQLKAVEQAMIARTQQDPTFQIVDSIPNINKNLAAQFTAETRGANRFTHFKQIEKLAGTNVRIADSGKYKGKRRMSKIGNPRLRRIIYQMTEQTARVVPQVRRRFLDRELRKKCYRKNIVAASSQLLRLIVALLRENRFYEERAHHAASLKTLERRYIKRYKKKQQPRRRTRVAA